MTVANMADVSSHNAVENSNNNSIQSSREKRVNAFDRLAHDLANDEKYLKEITLGKRIGFYRIRGELGTGNFCQVKMGIHSLTKGLAWLLRILQENVIKTTDWNFQLFCFLQKKLLSKSWIRQSWIRKHSDYCQGRSRRWRNYIIRTL